jgi:hypothetical protein
MISGLTNRKIADLGDPRLLRGRAWKKRFNLAAIITVHLPRRLLVACTWRAGRESASQNTKRNVRTSHWSVESRFGRGGLMRQTPRNVPSPKTPRQLSSGQTQAHVPRPARYFHQERKTFNYAILGNYVSNHRYHRSSPRLWRSGWYSGLDRQNPIRRIPRTVPRFSTHESPGPTSACLSGT